MSKKSTTNKAQVLKVFIAFMVLFIIVFSLGVFIGKGLKKEEIKITTKFQEQEQPGADIPAEEDEEPEPVIAYSDNDTDSGTDTYTDSDTDTDTDKETGLKEEALKTSPPPPVTPHPEVSKPDVEETAAPDKTVSPPEVATEARLAEITEQIRRERESTEAEQKGPTGEVVLPPIDPKGLYTVQIGSFQNQEQANSLASSLQSKGYPVFIKSMTTLDKENWYRVRVGTFGDIETAKTYGEGLKTMEPEVKLVFITVNN